MLLLLHEKFSEISDQFCMLVYSSADFLSPGVSFAVHIVHAGRLCVPLHPLSFLDLEISRSRPPPCSSHPNFLVVIIVFLFILVHLMLVSLCLECTLDATSHGLIKVEVLLKTESRECLWKWLAYPVEISV